MTAEELIQETLDKLGLDIDKDLKTCIIEDMQEFAKFHIEAALKAASEDPKIIIVTPRKDKYEPWGISEVNKDAILNAYPLDNIK